MVGIKRLILIHRHVVSFTSEIFVLKFSSVCRSWMVSLWTSRSAGVYKVKVSKTILIFFYIFVFSAILI